MIELDDFVLKEYMGSNSDRLFLNYLDNDPFVMRYITSSGLDNYFNRLTNNLNDFGINDNKVYIVYKGNIRIGVILIQKLVSYDDREFMEISYIIAPEYRNRGYASLLLKEYSNYYQDNYNSDLYLQIRNDNIYSRKAALNAGYVKDDGTRYVKKVNDRIR